MSDHRWFTVYDFLQAVSPLVEVLREAWSEHSFCYDVDVSAMEDNAKVVPNKLSQILTDPLFHAYSVMIRSVGTALLRITKWLEGCPSHMPLLVLNIERDDDAPHRRRHRRPERDIQLSCSAAGCRGPQLACGELQNGVKELHKFSHLEATMQLRKTQFRDEAAYSEAEACLQSDLEHLRAYLEMGLEVKLDSWSKLPWRLVGLAHHSEHERILTAQVVLALIDASPVPMAGQHLVTQRFLSPGR